MGVDIGYSRGVRERYSTVFQELDAEAGYYEPGASHRFSVMHDELGRGSDVLGSVEGKGTPAYGVVGRCRVRLFPVSWVMDQIDDARGRSGFGRR